MSCTYYRFNGAWWSGDYWCDKKDIRVDEDTYQRFCKDYNYDECSIYKESSASGGCFLTTIVCQILGKDDQDPVLETMRNFRDEILQNNKKYETILYDYDQLGPLLAYRLEQDPKALQIASQLYKNSLFKIAQCIHQKEYVKAIKLYQTMTLFFINHYGFHDIYVKYHQLIVETSEFPNNEKGHGKVWQLKNKKV